MENYNKLELNLNNSLLISYENSENEDFKTNKISSNNFYNKKKISKNKKYKKISQHILNEDNNSLDDNKIIKDNFKQKGNIEDDNNTDLEEFYDKLIKNDKKGILSIQNNKFKNDEKYYQKYYYFNYKELNLFDKNLRDIIYKNKIKKGNNYQVKINNINKRKKLNLNHFKIDSENLFKNKYFIKNLEKFKYIIYDNYNYYLNDSQIFNFYSHFKDYNLFKNILLTQNEILYNYISSIKNKILNLNK